MLKRTALLLVSSLLLSFASPVMAQVSPDTGAVKINLDENSINSSNPLIRTTARMREYKDGNIVDSSTEFWRSRPSNLAIDRSGGFAILDNREALPGIGLLTGAQAIDESLQLGSIGSDSRQNEQLLRNIKSAIEQYKIYNDEYPKSLLDFRGVSAYWASIWVQNENRNVSEFVDQVEYNPIMGEVETEPSKFLVSIEEYDIGYADVAEPYYNQRPLEEARIIADILLEGESVEDIDPTIKADKTNAVITKGSSPGIMEEVASELFTREAGEIFEVFIDTGIGPEPFIIVKLSTKKALDVEVAEKATDYKISFKQTTASVDISEIVAVDIESHDYEQMIKDEGLEFEIPNITKLAPADSLFIHFSDMDKYQQFYSALSGPESELISFLPLPNAEKMEVNVADRLGIPDAQKFIPLVSEFAFVAEDISFYPRTNYALIVKFKDENSEFLAQLLENGENKFGKVGEYFVFATHASIYKRIEDSLAGNTPSLASQADFHYGLGVLDKRRDGLVYFSDSFIRKLTGPEYRLNSRRRNTVLEALETLQYMSYAYYGLENKWPESLQDIADGGYMDISRVFESDKYSIDENGIVSHQEWGSIFKPTPINQVEISLITDQEKANYENFSERYHSYFREFFDPIGVAIMVSDQIAFHTVILPLIENSEYNMLRDMFGEAGNQDFDFINEPRRGTAVKGVLAFDMDHILYTIGSEFSGSKEKAEDAKRQADLKALETALQLYSIDNGGIFPESISDSVLVNEGYLQKAVIDPDGEDYLYSAVTDPDAEKKNTCFRLGARLSSENKSRMESDNGADPNLWELGMCFEHGNFEMVEPRAPENIDGPSREDIINEMEDEFKKELDLDWDGRIFDFIGDEIMIGMGEDNDFENIADIDLFIGVAIDDQKKAERFFSEVMKKIAEEMGVDDIGIFEVSKSGSLKNTYNDVDYYMVPTGFINLYYIFFEGRMYFAFSQKSINRLIDQAGSTDSKDVIRGMDFIGKQNDAMLSLDTAKMAAWLDTVNISRNILQGSLEQQVEYLGEAITLAQILPDYDGSLSNVKGIYKNIPETFFGWNFLVDNNDVYLTSGDEKLLIYSMNDTWGNQMDDNLDELFDNINVTETLKDLATNFSNIALGFKLTEHGVDIRMSFNNPHVNEVDERFNGSTQIAGKNINRGQVSQFIEKVWGENKLILGIGVGTLILILVIILIAVRLKRRPLVVKPSAPLEPDNKNIHPPRPAEKASPSNDPAESPPDISDKQ